MTFTPTPEAVEAVAKAICGKPEFWEATTEGVRDSYRKQARALSASLAPGGSVTDLIALRKRLSEEGKTVEGELARAEQRVTELKAERDEANRRANGTEVLLGKQSDRIKHLQNRVQSERRKGTRRLQQATEALTRIKVAAPNAQVYNEASDALAALAGEDDG